MSTPTRSQTAREFLLVGDLESAIHSIYPSDSNRVIELKCRYIRFKQREEMGLIESRNAEELFKDFIKETHDIIMQQ